MIRRVVFTGVLSLAILLALRGPDFQPFGAPRRADGRVRHRLHGEGFTGRRGHPLTS